MGWLLGRAAVERLVHERGGSALLPVVSAVERVADVLQIVEVLAWKLLFWPWRGPTGCEAQGATARDLRLGHAGDGVVHEIVALLLERRLPDVCDAGGELGDLSWAELLGARRRRRAA